MLSIGKASLLYWAVPGVSPVVCLLYHRDAGCDGLLCRLQDEDLVGALTSLHSGGSLSPCRECPDCLQKQGEDS